jgi:hypothetical protein
MSWTRRDTGWLAASNSREGGEAQQRAVCWNEVSKHAAHISQVDGLPRAKLNGIPIPWELVPDIFATSGDWARSSFARVVCLQAGTLIVVSPEDSCDFNGFISADSTYRIPLSVGDEAVAERTAAIALAAVQRCWGRRFKGSLEDELYSKRALSKMQGVGPLGSCGEAADASLITWHREDEIPGKILTFSLVRLRAFPPGMFVRVSARVPAELLGEKFHIAGCVDAVNAPEILDDSGAGLTCLAETIADCARKKYFSDQVAPVVTEILDPHSAQLDALLLI